MYYCACPEEGNNKKVVEENGKWYCEATQKTYDTCRRRYILRMKVSDASGAGWVNVFHDQACEMLGCDAETLHALRESDPSAYERKVKAAQFNAWSLKIRSKTEEYQGESRRRLTVVHCAKPISKPRRSTSSGSSRPSERRERDARRATTARRPGSRVPST